LAPGGWKPYRAWPNARTAKYQRIERVELREALPRNATGKLLRRELREPYWKKAG